MQTIPWEEIAEFYLDKATEFSRSFLEELLIHIIGSDKQTTDAVLVTCVDTFFDEKRKVLKDKLQEILRPYSSAYGTALDAEFQAALSSRLIDREADRIASLLEENFPANFTDRTGRGLSRDKVKRVIGAAQEASAWRIWY